MRVTTLAKKEKDVMSKKDGGSAYPTTRVSFNGNVVPDEVGMSLRDYFAAKAMQAAATGSMEGMSKEGLAVWAYQMADAMLAVRAATPPQQAPAPQPVGLTEQQEPKYTVDGNAIVNRANGEAIPADEPVFIFRARDVHAMYALRDYSMRLPLGSDHKRAVDARVMDFFDFKAKNPDRMKEPDTERTHGIPAPQATQQEKTR